MAEQHEEHEEQDENAPRECCGSTACPPGYEDNSPCKARWNWCIAISAGPIWIMWVVWIITNPGQAVIFLVRERNSVNRLRDQAARCRAPASLCLGDRPPLFPRASHSQPEPAHATACGRPVRRCDPHHPLLILTITPRSVCAVHLFGSSRGPRLLAEESQGEEACMGTGN